MSFGPSRCPEKVNCFQSRTRFRTGGGGLSRRAGAPPEREVSDSQPDALAESGRGEAGLACTNCSKLRFTSKKRTLVQARE